MDTNKIKRFATEARKILKAGIAAKIASLGFDKLGDVVEENKPQLMQGGSLWKEQLLKLLADHDGVMITKQRGSIDNR